MPRGGRGKECPSTGREGGLAAAGQLGPGRVAGPPLGEAGLREVSLGSDSPGPQGQGGLIQQALRNWWQFEQGELKKKPKPKPKQSRGGAGGDTEQPQAFLLSSPAIQGSQALCCRCKPTSHSLITKALVATTVPSPGCPEMPWALSLPER